MTALRYLIALPRAQTTSSGTSTGSSTGAGILTLVGRPADVQPGRASIWISDRASLICSPVGAWLIGAMFERQTGRRVDPATFAALTSSADTPQTLARDLCEQFWGGYVALIPSDTGRFLLRSPLGQLPCYRTYARGCDIYASDARLLVETGYLVPQVNWPALDAHVRWPDLRTAATCLADLEECAPGSLMLVDASKPLGEPVWSPWRSAKPQETRPAPAASPRDLRQTICDAVTAWTLGEHHVLVTASGGLDSSIVCAALAAIGKPFSCLTLATADPSGDERPYVRMLARHFGVPVIEHIWDPQSIDLSLSASAHLPRPTRKSFAQQVDVALRDAAGSSQARLVLDGNGGDHIFCFLHSSRPVVDRLLVEGLTRGTFKTFLDVCETTGSDVMAMARTVWKHRSGRTFDEGWKRDDRFLTRGDADDRPPDALTPFLTKADGALPGKTAHVAQLMHIQNHLDGPDALGPVTVLSPLLSQPVVEYCLSVPSWVWFDGGVNRSLAHKAFQDVLPRPIIERVSKAGPDSFIVQAFEGNRAVLREHLLDGRLAGHGLADRIAVEQAMGDPATIRNGGIYRLLDLAEAEAWVRSWTG